ncbi:retinoic acid-induced protein 1-like [Cololabis saira]|uniref:retinoic acid-induced protein 1-like n=1 Tax=Cololabis saira TaxID=129043 RepID=UPI002AD2816C|nr:retinoic acid-induced protein 1-like [Cololabis saira]
MDVSPQDPPLMAMDLSKSYSPRTCGRPEAVDLAKKPEWYHRRPPGCSADVGSPFRPRALPSFGPLASPPGGRCRDVEHGAESLGDYVNSAVDLYHDGVRGGLWHAGFYRADQGAGAAVGSPVPESSGGEESDSGSDVIFLVSSAKEPLLCGSFLPDGVGHMMTPASPATASSPDEGAAGCFLLPAPASSLSADSSYSEDSSDSSVDIPAQHSRPVVLLSDLGAVYGSGAGSPIDVSSDDSEVVEVSVTSGNRRADGWSRSPSSGGSVRRSSRVRKSPSETPPLLLSCSGGSSRGGAARESLTRRAKHSAVGIYNESGDSDDLMEYVARLSSSDDSPAPPRASSGSGDSDRKSPLRAAPPRRSFRQNPPPPAPTAVKPRGSPVPPAPRPLQDTAKRTAARRRRKRRRPAGPPGPPGLFPPAEPQFQLKFSYAKEKKKKSDGFGPFVHVEPRLCRVVNYEDEAVPVRGAAPASASLPGFVPTTSCFLLGRPGSGGPAAPQCCLCRQAANATGLGDLHGPYRPSRAPTAAAPHGLANGRPGNSSEDDGAAENGSPGSPAAPLRLDECWVHEDCGIWSNGVFLVRGRLYGLEEAARVAQETTCSACGQSGAIVGCFQKGCCRNYHYACAVQSGCILNEDNFSMRCPEHKNKLFTTTTRRCRR